MKRSLKMSNWFRAALLVMFVICGAFFSFAYAEECVIDLNNNTHTCQSISAINFISQPVNNQAVVRISFDPALYKHTKAVFEVSYDKQPSAWTVNIGDSKSNNGNGGDGGDTSNAAEMQILDTDMSVYSNTLPGYETQVLDGSLLLHTESNVISQGKSISLEVSNERLHWTSPSGGGEVFSKYLYTLKGQNTVYGPVDYDIYAAFNRVIGTDRRSGSGVNSVRIRLVQETQEPPSPPLILPTQDFNKDLKLSLHTRTNKIRFMAPKNEDFSKTFAISQPLGLSPSASPEEAARHFLVANGASFGLEQTTELKLMREKVASRNRSIVRFQQQYQGIPVLGGEVIVQMDAAKNVMSVNGEISPDLATQKLKTTPSVSVENAVKTASGVTAKKYKADAGKLSVSAPQLWIFNPAILGIPGAQFNSLIWRVEVISSEKTTPIRDVLLVDAHLGAVLFSYSQIYNAKDRKIYDNNNDQFSGLPGIGPVRSEGGSATGIPDRDNAYDYSGDTYDFYMNVHGRDSIDGNGMSLVSTVRYCEAGSSCPYKNAFWNGQQMVYGQGFANADDVVAHELTHGVTERTSGLFYFYQSGAINESFSDLWGEFVDQNNGKGNDSPAVKWLMGEDIGAIRNMKDPAQFGQPDRIGSPNYHCDWWDAGGVHINSGINNKAVYLMTDGGTFNGYTMNGLGWEKVVKLYYEVQTNLLTSASDYADLYDALLQACINLQYDSADCQQVQKALDATQMNQQPAVCPVNEAPLCDNPDEVATDVFFDNFESGGGNWIIKGVIQGTTKPNWFIPQTSETIIQGLEGPYATSGKGNVWGFDQGREIGGISDTNLAMKNGIILPPNAFMHFNHSFNFESDDNGNYDGGVLEYSINGGSSWISAESLIINNTYNGSIATGYDNPLAGKKAFTGTSRGYISTRLNLSSLAGQNVRFRFRIGTDDMYPDYGWFIDDVRVYACKPVKDVCAKPTTQSKSGGKWGDAIWTNGYPNENSVVLINSGHTINIAGGLTPIKFKALCNSGTLQETTGGQLYLQSDLASGFIYNEGTISGQNGKTSTMKSDIVHKIFENHGDGGTSINLKTNQFYNTDKGIIKAGQGGAGYFYGGSGGSVEIYANTIKNAGKIASGNGGEGNAHQPAWDGFGSKTGDSSNIPIYGNKPVSGGKGGRTMLLSTKSLNENSPSEIYSGEGGNAYVWCVNGAHLTDTWSDGRWIAGICVSDTGIPVAIPTPGEGGDLYKLAPTLNLPPSKAKSGKAVYYEPNSITAGPDTRIEAKEDIVIFGGSDWILDLRNLSEGAISTEGNIVLAVGSGSSIDLRGSNAKVFKAGGQFKVFADNILLDSGVTLENIAQAAGGVVKGSSKIMRRVVLNAPEQVNGEHDTSISVELTIINAGPEGDSYTLMVSDSAGWKLSSLPSPLMLKGLEAKHLMLNITLPSIVGETDIITVKAVSQSDPMAVSVEEIHVSVTENKPILTEYIVSGIIKDKSGAPLADVSVQVGDKTVMTDAMGAWQITGLQEGNYTATASKDGYVFTSQDVTLSNGQNATVAIKTTSEPYPYSSGVFTVSDTGIVKIDWLYDGGKYQGEFGIFNLAGMDTLTPGSPEFIAEAVKRVMSDSDQGYLVFSDLSEGARFSGLLGGEVKDWNAGPYKGVKSFEMTPGTRFATVLVPNSTFASLAQNPGTEDPNKRPLFSLVSSNPAYGMSVGQIADINGTGKAFAYEDKNAATSDWDFNDLIIQITGAESNVQTMDQLESQRLAKSARQKRDRSDWRDSELGRAILEHVEAPAAAEDSLSMTVTLNIPTTLLVYDSTGKVIGKAGGTIAGANFELKADGTQTVTLPNPAGNYRVAIQGAATAQSTLTVKTYQGGAEISSAGIPVDIAPHQILTTTISADGHPPVVAPINAATSYDFNGDGVTDNADVSMLVRHWNSCKGQQKYDAFFDVNDDGGITVADIMMVLNAKTVK